MHNKNCQNRNIAGDEQERQVVALTKERIQKKRLKIDNIISSNF